MTDCSICAESYNNSNHSKIECKTCNFECCADCIKKYNLIDGPIKQFDCMNCKTEFSRSALFDVFGTKFMTTTFKTIRENVLFEIEKGFFGKTQEDLERQIKIDELKDELRAIPDKYKKLHHDAMMKIISFRSSMNSIPIKDAIDKYVSMIAIMEHLSFQRAEEEDAIMHKLRKIESADSNISNTYSSVCQNSNCNGLLSLSTLDKKGNFLCALCKTAVCKTCMMMVERDSNHECDSDILLSIEHISSNSKPCPSCKSIIHKIEGCDQMFCVQCHTSFNWATLKINNGRIHNPHYEEWIGQQGGRLRNALDIQCGRSISDEYEDIISLCKMYIMSGSFYIGINNTNCVKIIKNLESVLHMAVYHANRTIPTLTGNLYSIDTNSNLRMKLLKNEITESQFKTKIQQRDKSCCRNMELCDIFITFRDAMTDIIWDYYKNGAEKTYNDWCMLDNEISSLVAYLDSCLLRISYVYKTKSYTSVMHN